MSSVALAEIEMGTTGQKRYPRVTHTKSLRRSTSFNLDRRDQHTIVPEPSAAKLARPYIHVPIVRTSPDNRHQDPAALGVWRTEDGSCRAPIDITQASVVSTRMAMPVPQIR